MSIRKYVCDFTTLFHVIHPFSVRLAFPPFSRPSLRNRPEVFVPSRRERACVLRRTARRISGALSLSCCAVRRLREERRERLCRGVCARRAAAHAQTLCGWVDGDDTDPSVATTRTRSTDERTPMNDTSLSNMSSQLSATGSRSFSSLFIAFTTSSKSSSSSFSCSSFSRRTFSKNSFGSPVNSAGDCIWTFFLSNIEWISSISGSYWQKKANFIKKNQTRFCSRIKKYQRTWCISNFFLFLSFFVLRLVFSRLFIQSNDRFNVTIEKRNIITAIPMF